MCDSHIDNFPRQGTTWLTADEKMGVFTVGVLTAGV
jgi:hypothetical protein